MHTFNYNTEDEEELRTVTVVEIGKNKHGHLWAGLCEDNDNSDSEYFEAVLCKDGRWRTTSDSTLITFYKRT